MDIDFLFMWICILFSYFQLITDSSYLEIQVYIPLLFQPSNNRGSTAGKKEILEVFLGIRQIGSFAAWMQ